MCPLTAQELVYVIYVICAVYHDDDQDAMGSMWTYKMENTKL